MSSEPTSLVHVPGRDLERPSPAALKAESAALREIQSAVLVEGTDYGVIKGTPRPSLYKSGAEWLLRWARFGHRFERVEVERTAEGVKVGVTYRCLVFSLAEPDTIIATCDGYAGWDENRWRSSGWNTLLKMAQKRALVGATLQATGASGLFTQDIEDGGIGHDDDLGDEPMAKAADVKALAERIRAFPDEAREQVKALMAEEDPPISFTRRVTASELAKVTEWADQHDPASDASDGAETPAEEDAAGDAATATPSESPDPAPASTEAGADATPPQDPPQGPAEPTEAPDPAAAFREHLADATDEQVDAAIEAVKALKAHDVDKELTRLRQHSEGEITERRRRLGLALLYETLHGGPPAEQIP